MAEPTVQVPVSLIEEAAWVFKVTGRRELGNKFADLLMPPKTLHVNDLAPGTTFTAELTRYPGRPLRFARDYGPYVVVDGFNYVSAEVDPSTIRDVTPPEDAA